MARKKKLPQVGTSAASTVFCSAEIKGPGGSLWMDGNGKITSRNGTLSDPKPNAFSLRAQAVTDAVGQDTVDCPGSTSVCRASCYVGGLEKHARDTYDLYVHNSKMIRQILGGPQAAYWALLVATWICKNARGGFRWHVSGDVYSAEYAKWIATVCLYSKKVDHWVYTRSFDYVPYLAVAPNLAINLSADSENYEAAALCRLRMPRTRICYLTVDGTVPDDLREGDVIFPDYNLRGGTEEGRAWFETLPPHYKAMVCQVDYMGKAENRRCSPDHCSRCLA